MSTQKDDNDTNTVVDGMAQALDDASAASYIITTTYRDFLNKKVTEGEALKTMLEEKLVITNAIEAVENTSLKLANPLLNTYLLMKYLDLKDLLREADNTLDSFSSVMTGSCLQEMHKVNKADITKE